MKGITKSFPEEVAISHGSGRAAKRSMLINKHARLTTKDPHTPRSVQSTKYRYRFHVLLTLTDRYRVHVLLTLTVRHNVGYWHSGPDRPTWR